MHSRGIAKPAPAVRPMECGERTKVDCENWELLNRLNFFFYTFRFFKYLQTFFLFLKFACIIIYFTLTKNY